MMELNEQNRTIFSGMQILANHQSVNKQWLKKHAVIVENKTIKAIIPEDMIKHHLPAKHYQFQETHYLTPGFIDLHIHGTHNFDVMDGTEKALANISEALACEGVTGFLATTMTASNEKIEAVLQQIASVQNEEGAAILGIHLEGPFIAKAGAQDRDKLQLPDDDLIRHWQKIAKDKIKIVTLAPELQGADRLIKAIIDMDVIVSVGHTHANYDETRKAIELGCTHATHLFNAMTGIHQREPGAVSALLLSSRVNTEIIVDGIHLHPAIVDMTLRLKNKDHVLLVTDAMRAKCLRDGQYELGGQQVTVTDGKATLADGTLAGSTLRIPQAIKNMMSFTQCSLIDAINMASINPARVLKLDLQKGDITIGKDADLVVLDSNLEVCLTMREGKEIFRA